MADHIEHGDIGEQWRHSSPAAGSINGPTNLENALARFLGKLNMNVSYGPAIPLLALCPREMGRCLGRWDKKVHGSIVCKNQKGDNPQRRTINTWW